MECPSIFVSVSVSVSVSVFVSVLVFVLVLVSVLVLVFVSVLVLVLVLTRRDLAPMPKRRFSSCRTKLAAISFIKLARSPFGSR